MVANPQDQRVAQRLRALRDEKRITQQALSAALGFNDRQTLAAIEAGERRIQPDELVRAAEALGVGLEVFLDPYRLVGEGAFSFRASEVAADDLRSFQARAGRWIATYRELGILAGVEPRWLANRLEVTVRSTFEDVAAAAERLGRTLDLGPVPAERLQGAIERELGILVLHVDAPRGISGAALRLPGQDTILVNRAESPGRRSFDLAHELFHVLTWDAMPPQPVEPREVRPTKGNRVEQMAENFAAALLMPFAVMAERWERRGDEPVPEWAARTAGELRVSTPAVVWRLVNLGLLPRATGEALKGAPRAVVPREAAGEPLLFSRPFVARVADAVDEGRLALRRAAELLDVPVLTLAETCRAHGRPLAYDLLG